MDDAPPEPSDITLGNGEANQINLTNMRRAGPTLTVSNVTAAQDSFLVLHPFADGAPVQTDYVAARFVTAGSADDVMVRLDNTPETGTPFIIMLHHDVNGDGQFQFGDGVSVPDAPVFEGSTLIAMPMTAPEDEPVIPALIRASAQEHADKAANFLERADYRDDALLARSRALIHNYLAIIESDDRSVDQMTPLFVDEFQINFPSGTIESAEALEAWLSGPASAFAATRHVLHDVNVSPLSDTRYRIEMEMSWDGLTMTGDRMSARTAHDWVILDTIQDKDEALLIETISVTILEPFAPAAWE